MPLTLGHRLKAWKGHTSLRRFAVSAAVLSLVAAGCNPSSSGSITISPSTFTCTGEGHTVTIQLPASVQATDLITIKEGAVQGAGVFDTKSVQQWGFTQEAGGSWQLVDTQAFYAYICAFYISRAYTMYVLDSNGNVLAQGSYSEQ